jgi:uncharacterized membrane protein (UPF0127 family)
MSTSLTRRTFAIFGLLLALVASQGAAVSAQGLRPYEPLDPAKAQSLPVSALTIESGGKSHAFTVELATTDSQRNIGLMHRNALADDRGMLFDFQKEQRARFWMRNTFIPLDMIFIRATGHIAAIAENTVPHSEQPVGPPQAVQAVLEVPGGLAARLGLKPGDVVRHPIFKNAPSR